MIIVLVVNVGKVFDLKFILVVYIFYRFLYENCNFRGLGVICEFS